MNFTTISIPSNNLKRIKGHYIAAAAGIALLASGVFGGTPWHHDGKPVTNAARVTGGIAPQPVPMQVYYIVASEAERDMLATEFGGNFIVKGSDRETLLYGDQAASMTEAGVDFRVIDTTKPNWGPVSSSASQADTDIAASVRSTEDALYGARVEQRAASAADIAASVLSTELANFVTPVQQSESDADRLTSVLGPEFSSYASMIPVARVLEADIAASVLSTEMAAYDFTAARLAERQALEADIMASVISTEKAAGY